MPRVHTGESVLARGARIIEAFGHDERTLTVTEIARRSGLHVATASRLIEELVGVGWLERVGRRVGIGVRLWEVASRASPAVGLREAAMPFMEDVHSVVAQHTQLAVREGTSVLFLERLSTPGAAINYTRIAGRLPLHASSSGLVLLAHAPTAYRNAVLDAPMEVFTDQTIHTPAGNCALHWRRCAGRATRCARAISSRRPPASLCRSAVEATPSWRRSR